MEVSSHHFFLFFFSFSILITITPARQGRCLEDQKKLLLDLKSELIFNSSTSHYLVNWNETDDDCCQWRRIECDEAGHVISLILSEENISGGIGESSSLFRLTYLSKLDLSRNRFTATQIPRSIHRLSNLRYIYFVFAGFVGPIPSTLANLTRLVGLHLQGNFLTAIPSTLANLPELRHLDLSANSLTNSIPSFRNCPKLEFVDLSMNNLKGSLSHLHFQGLVNLSHLDLSSNSLSGTIPHHLFTLPSVEALSLNNNLFDGQIRGIEIVNVSNLGFLDLSSNRIEGPIPNSFFHLKGLWTLRLSNNLFNDTFKLEMVQNLPKISILDLSYNNLSVETTNTNWEPSTLSRLYLSSNNLHDFPDLRKYSSLRDLDLSNNLIGGVIPSWIWETDIMVLNLSLNRLTDLERPYHIQPHIESLDLHSNRLRNEFPLLPQFNSPTVFFLSNNSLSGVIPPSICNASKQFLVLDLSFNNLSGSIPPCLVEKDFVRYMLSLRGNNMTGVIPDQFSFKCDLRTFDVSNNNLGGKIPKSLANCEALVVMNVGNNNFDDTFPCMLPLSLRILVLRSNRFHGDLKCHKSWPNLQIVDISSNNFSGTLNPLNLSSWRGMMLQSPLRPKRSNSSFLGENWFYRDEVDITVKGVEVKLVKIWPDFTSLDLSCNNFEGDIPDAIGNLTSLYLLNLSNNALTSSIPKSLGELTELGSLDLSANHLAGRIPEEIAQLTFLSFLNVSHNHLIGKIPSGPQFQTFPATSFEGNTGLCGFPLNTSCSSPPHGSGVMASQSEDDEIEWEYVFVAVGYVVGLGTIAWTLLCCRNLRERYFEKIEEVVDKIFYERAGRRRHERRVEMRNEVIRRRHQRG